MSAAKSWRAAFRQDLLFRLNTIEIALPPLRETEEEDIPLLADHFLREPRNAVIASSWRHSLPRRANCSVNIRGREGNVRELNHVVERAVLMAQGPIIQPGGSGFARGAGERPRAWKR
jgi:transcriptional regulator with GAF, ATPase, and Fis domain